MAKISFLISSIVWCLLNVSCEAQLLCPAGFSCSKAPEQVSSARNTYNDWVLVPCPPGTFSELGQEDCSQCGPGSFTNTSGSTVCLVCPVGHMCVEADKDPLPCPAGTYSSCTGQVCCSSCPLGTYTFQLGSTHCINCPAGVRCPTSPTIVCHGDLLSPKHQAILTGFTGKRNLKWTLLYKATRDGFKSLDFHRLSDGHAPTMTIIQSQQGYLFGGYTNAFWNGSNIFGYDRDSFIFTLLNPHAIPPTRFVVKSGHEKYAVYRNSSHGPTFGGGHDIRIIHQPSSFDGYIGFPYTYIDTSGKGNRLFTDSQTFPIGDIEVYRLSG